MNLRTFWISVQSSCRLRAVNRRSETPTLPMLLLVGLLLSLAAAPPVLAADWASCQDDLDRLRSAAGDAADAAETVNSAADEVESARSSLNLCRLGRNDCWFERSQYDSAVSDYESAKANLEGELDTASSAIRSAEMSCEYDLGTGQKTTTRGRPTDRICAAIRRLKGRMPDRTLMEICTKSKTEEECKRCVE